MAQNLNPYYMVTDKVDSDDGAGTFTVAEIPAKTLVMCSCVVVSTLWAGTSPTIDLGAGSNADAFVDNTDVTQGTVGAYFGDGGDATSYEGQYYAAKTPVTITIGGTPSAGECVGVLQCLDLSDVV